MHDITSDRKLATKTDFQSRWLSRQKSACYDLEGESARANFK